MIELKPCPFCGGKAKICATTTKTYPKDHGQHWCYCEKCGATGQSFSDFEDDGSSVFKAIEAWNRRDDNESESSLDDILNFVFQSIKIAIAKERISELKGQVDSLLVTMEDNNDEKK